MNLLHRRNLVTIKERKITEYVNLIKCTTVFYEINSSFTNLTRKIAFLGTLQLENPTVVACSGRHVTRCFTIVVSNGRLLSDLVS